MACVLSNILDPVTRKDFTNGKILSNFQAMKHRILETATENDTTGASMDIGNVSIHNSKAEVHNIATPEKKVNNHTARQHSLTTSDSPASLMWHQVKSP